MGTFRTSEGERLTKTTIDNLIRKAKTAFCLQREYDEIMYCEACGTTSDRLDCSHIVSVDDCQKDGMTEFAFSVDNMQRECRKCHMETERGTIDHHANYRAKIDFIEHYSQIKSTIRQ